MLSSLLIFLPRNTLHNTMYIVYSISLLLFSDIYCGGAYPFCVPALRKWMTISVLGFASFPSSLTQMFPKIIFFFQDSNCVYVTQTNPSPKRLESILHLPFHLINRPSKLIISHSELTKGRNENSLSHWVAETVDSYTAPLPLLSLLSWSYVHPWLEDPIWRSYVLLRQVLYTLGSSVRQHFRSSLQNQTP